ncbi:DUF1249 domain-containing protein [Corallincola luteus]|uniref:DUF1249 domain-containing protein n=1 Tax=Corallincola luteus TaxID=1775177 RepID=A0ABY2ANX6_9GAMM|nr:DUF1249 domain-containing protein [Corallincola luteus]TCI04905.1 DUF1249 domain-containing protein [Corallincola luteus]
MSRSGRYQPDVSAFLRCCEHNYASLRFLLVRLDSAGDTLFWALDTHTQVSMQLVEETKYTSTILLEQHRAGAAAFLLPQMTVRLYHDARVAEVLTSQQISRLKPRYDYPNKKMHHKDEKIQVNQFLAEWLQHSKKFGYGTAPLIQVDPVSGK